jgi:hypothetical protein
VFVLLHPELVLFGPEQLYLRVQLVYEGEVVEGARRSGRGTELF